MKIALKSFSLYRDFLLDRSFPSMQELNRAQKPTSQTNKHGRQNVSNQHHSSPSKNQTEQRKDSWINEAQVLSTFQPCTYQIDRATNTAYSQNDNVGIELHKQAPQVSHCH